MTNTQHQHSRTESLPDVRDGIVYRKWTAYCACGDFSTTSSQSAGQARMHLQIMHTRSV